MQNENELKVRKEKVINKPVSEVFRALGEGRLFLNCSADSRDMKIDFHVGGKYFINFKSHGVTNFGEFLEIVPNKKIVFTWCLTYEDERKPDSTVTIDLIEDGNKTKLVLVHTGFTTKESRDDHEGGWSAGVNDLSTELENAQITMVRVFELPVEKLFEFCLSELKGEVKDKTPSEKLTLKTDPKVTMNFSKEEKWGESSVELKVDVPSQKEILQQRKLWEEILEGWAAKTSK